MIHDAMSGLFSESIFVVLLEQKGFFFKFDFWIIFKIKLQLTI